MKREKVIIFEGEHMFVAPKNTVYDKKTGMTHTIPEFANLVDPKTAESLPILTTGGIAGDTDTRTQDTNTQTNLVSSGTARYAGTDTTVSPIGGGGAVRTPIVEMETTTSSTTSTTTAAPKIEQTLNVPLNLGLPLQSQMARSGGGGGGGGGSASGEGKPQANVFVTLLKKYWWVGLIVAAGVGGYFYAKRKK